MQKLNFILKKTILIFLILSGLISKSQSTLIPTSPYVRSNIDWVQYLSQRSSVANASSALDANNNVYLTGYSTSSGTTNAGIVTVKYDSLGVVQFTAGFNNSGYDEGKAIKIDAVGNSFITGITTGTAGTGLDAITIKYSPSGTQLWATPWDGGIAGTDEAYDLKLDATGDVYIVGKSYSNLGYYQILVVKYNGSTGSKIWDKVFTVNGLDDSAVALTISSNSQYVIVTANITDISNGNDIYTFQLDASSGISGWNQTINGTGNGNDIAKAIILAGANVVICGEVVNANSDYVIAKYDVATGSQVFKVDYDFSVTTDRATALVKDSTGNIAVTGVVLDASVYKYHTVLYDSTGVKKWVNVETTNLGVTTVDPKIACDSIAHHFYVCGELMRTTKDILAYQITPTGNTTWKETFDGQNLDIDAATNLVVNGVGQVFLSALSKNSSADYDITTIKISQTPVYFPPDFNSEPPSHATLFYENKGQLVDMNDSLIPNINFYTTSSPEQFFDNNSIKYVFKRLDSTNATTDTTSRIDLYFSESNPFAKAYAYSPVQGNLNYYLGHCPNGINDVRGFERIITPNIYPNIDLHIYSNDNGLKYYLVVKPGANPNDIIMSYNGSISSTITGSGGLIIDGGIGKIEQDAPIAFQVVLTGTAVTILPITGWQATYVSLNSSTYKFGLGAYNTALPLVIEVGKATSTVAAAASTPEWGTMYGGSGDDIAYDIITDPSGNLYATGSTGGPTFPVSTGTNVFSYGGGVYDAFITKFTSTYSRAYSTFYGGTKDDQGFGIAYDSQNNKVYICGSTLSQTTFPTASLPSTSGSFVDNKSGNLGLDGKGIIVRFNATTGAREWATKFGGMGECPLIKIKADNNGNIYVAGNIALSNYVSTCSPVSSGDLPLCNPGSGAYFQSVNNSMMLGSAANNDYYNDCFIGKFNSNTNLIWSTLFGGDGDDFINDIAIDETNQKLYLVGTTRSTQSGSPVCNYTSTASFPVCNNGGGYFQQDLNIASANTNYNRDGFISKFSLSGALEHSTFFGGNNNDEIGGVLVDNSGNVFITGRSATNLYSNNNCTVATNGGFPFCPASSYTQSFSGVYDAFVAKFDNNFDLAWSSFYGGPSREAPMISWGSNFKIAINKFTNEIYVVGNTNSCNTFPVLSKTNYFYKGTHADAAGNFCTYGSNDGFVLGFDNTGVRSMSTYFGGYGWLSGSTPQESDYINAITTIGDRVYVCGKTYSYAFFPLFQPISGSPYYQSYSSNTYLASDAFYAQLKNSSSIVNIKENEVLNNKESKIKLYPNPTNGLLNIEWINNSPNSLKANICVYNIMGQLVNESEAIQNYGKNSIAVLLERLAPGVYSVVIRKDKEAFSSKFIIE
jgi:hypothetical protein